MGGIHGDLLNPPVHHPNHQIVGTFSTYRLPSPFTYRLNYRRFLPAVDSIEARAKQTHQWDDREFETAVADLKRDALQSGTPKKSNRETRARREFMIRAATLFNEAVYRTLKFHLHRVQLAALLAASRGAIVEMQTGEGKSVVTAGIAFLKSLDFPHVHVATTNSYLAQRDFENHQSLFELLQTKSTCLPNDGSLEETQAAYACNVTYGPGYQFGFDFLKDQITLRTERPDALGHTVLSQIHGLDIRDKLLQPHPHYAMVVDEADCVMIDEALTPLILSGPNENQIDPQIYITADQLAKSLVGNEDFIVHPTRRTIELTDQARQKIYEAFGQLNHLAIERPWSEYIRNALQAQHLLQDGEHYVVKDDAVQIVDQMTGRIFPDRSWKNGLHQAVEAKSRVSIKPGNGTQARVTRQRYFQFYRDLCGLTGTATQVTQEFSDSYSCPVVEIPTHRPSLRKALPTRFFTTRTSKWEAIAECVAARNATGQPVLIGTRTIRDSLELEQVLRSLGLEPVLLNGVQDQDEAQIIALAGQKGAITIATNMAGRGTDIKLHQDVVELGGLHVIATEHHASLRVDRQLLGRAARQGQPGSFQFFICAEDPLIANHAPALAKSIERRANNQGECEYDFSNQIQRLQQQLELENYEARQAMVRQDRWLDRVRYAVEGKGDASHV